MANWEKTAGPTQEPLEGLYLTAGLGMLGSCPGKGRLVCPGMPAASATQTWISGKKMDGWMEVFEVLKFYMNFVIVF